MDDMTDIERLVALEDIKRIKAQRDRAIDTKDWALYEALHIPDAKSHADGVPPWTSTKVMVKEISARLEGRATAHHCHTPDISFQSRDEASGIWGMEDSLFWKQGDEDHWYHGFGFYHETYVRVDGKWLFASRRLKRTYTSMSEGAILTPLPK